MKNLFTLLFLASFCLVKAQTSLTDSLFIEKKIGEITYTDVIVKYNSKQAMDVFKKLGGTINRPTSDFFTGKIPSDSLSKAKAVNGLIIIKSTKVIPQLESVRSALDINLIHNGAGLSAKYKGKGVIIGIIDIGFDYSHINFRDTSLDLRISRVWEQNIEGTPPPNYDYGNEVTNKNLIRELGTDNTFGTSGEQHGTHVAGIAAGSGLLSDKYIGIAPEAELVFVSTDLTDKGILEGIEYIFDYAESEGKPCVINISIGGHFGPHDGTSIFDQVTKQLIGEGKIIVGSAGNEGNDYIHTSTVNNSGNELLTFMSNQSGKPQVSSNIDIWGEEGQPIEVQIGIYNINDNEIESFYTLSNNEIITAGSTGNLKSTTLEDSDYFFPDKVPVRFIYEINPLNNKPHVIVSFDNNNQDDNYKPIYLYINSPSKNVHAWNIESSSRFYNYGLNATNGDNSYTVGEIGGTGEAIISVGALNNQNQYLDYKSITRNSFYQGVFGQRAIFSSMGPTVDNRTKPDISAPGNVIASSFNEYYPAVKSDPTKLTDVFQHNRIPGKSYYFGVMQGTSMSAPVVTGTIALLLQQNPLLTKEEIMQLFKEESNIIANNEIGLGMINTYNIIKRVDQITSIEKELFSSSNINVYPNPSNGEITINLDSEYVIYNSSGIEVVRGTEQNINLSRGFYIIRSADKSAKVVIE
jgi:minor extracellular serine protease Vpr